jgi:ferredoxin
MGAGALLLVNDDSLPERTRALIASRVARMQTMLAALGTTPNRLAWLSPVELLGWLARHNAVAHPLPSVSPQVPSNKSWFKYKRLAWIDTLRLLGAAANVPAATELPEGAAFGEVRVNKQRCTLCFACSNLCPTRALVGHTEATKQLVFQESACVQCGLCVSGCPEKALSLHPRLAPKVMMQMGSTVLHQDEQLACKSCGTPFINRRLLALSIELLKRHPGMGDGAREALMRCPDCRQKEMLDV